MYERAKEGVQSVAGTGTGTGSNTGAGGGAAAYESKDTTDTSQKVPLTERIKQTLGMGQPCT